MGEGGIGRRVLLARSGAWAAALCVPTLPLLGGCDRSEQAPAPADRPSADRGGAKPPAAVPSGSESAKPGFFDATQLSIVTAAVERLLPELQQAGPPTASGQAGLPGAAGAGVARFIDAQLASPDFEGLQRMMGAGVGFLDRTARRDHGAAFTAAGPDAQDAVLTAFQAGGVGGLRFPQARFFEQLLTFALEGYLGAPRHGGNREGAVWAALGIDPRCHNMYERC